MPRARSRHGPTGPSVIGFPPTYPGSFRFRAGGRGRRCQTPAADPGAGSEAPDRPRRLAHRNERCFKVGRPGREEETPAGPDEGALVVFQGLPVRPARWASTSCLFHTGRLPM
jgi:hypothetical protein